MAAIISDDFVGRYITTPEVFVTDDPADISPCELPTPGTHVSCACILCPSTLTWLPFTDPNLLTFLSLRVMYIYIYINCLRYKSYSPSLALPLVLKTPKYDQYKPFRHTSKA